MGENAAFLAEITAFVNKAKTNQEAVVRAVGIKILNQLVVMSPVGNPELWKVNQTAVSYNRAVYDHNEAQRANPDNLTKTGRLKKKPGWWMGWISKHRRGIRADAFAVTGRCPLMRQRLTRQGE